MLDVERLAGLRARVAAIGNHAVFEVPAILEGVLAKSTRSKRSLRCTRSPHPRERWNSASILQPAQAARKVRNGRRRSLAGRSGRAHPA